VILPLTPRTVLLVTLVSVIGSLLAFDQFYIMTAGQPQNETATSVFYVYLNSFPYLKLGYGAALSMVLALTILAFTVVQLAAHPTEPRVTVSLQARQRGRVATPVRARRSGYLLAAVCVAICTVMALPLLMSVLASVKPTEEAAASPPTYLPHSLSLDSYERLWSYQQGLPTYLANSLGTALLTIAFTLVLTVPAAYALARFPIPGKEAIFVLPLLSLIVPCQALLTPMFLMFARIGLTNTLVGLAVVHTAIQLPFSLYVLRNSLAAVPREREEAAVTDGASSWQVLVRIFIPSSVPAIVTVALFAFIMSWNEFLGALVMMSKGASFTLPLILAAACTETSLGGTDWGMLQAGITISIIPCVFVYLLLQRYYVSGLMTGAVK
jgi:multiple sugar transport system permease protein